MANASTNVVAGHPLASGGALVAPIGTALPTDETTALNVAFKALGYLSKDGVGINPNRSSDKTTAWGGDVVLVQQTEFGVEVKVTLIESLNSVALKTAFGSANVATTAATVSTGTKQAIKINSLELDHQEWVFEIRNGAKKIRHVIPDGQVTKVDEIKYTDSDAVGYACTITCSPDATGNYVYTYTDDGKTT